LENRIELFSKKVLELLVRVFMFMISQAEDEEEEENNKARESRIEMRQP